MGKVVFKSRSREVLSKIEVVMDSALDRMGEDGVKIARMRIPYASGDLFKAVEHVKIAPLAHRVRVEKEYAGYQEMGRRKDGSHVVKKYTTPSTGKEFLRDMARNLIRNAINYFKQAAQSV